MNTINSKSKVGNLVKIPFFYGHVKMLPFNPKTVLEVPKRFRNTIMQMLSNLPYLPEVAYLTIDGKVLLPNKSHRRPGAHIDGNYLSEICGWGSSTGGWKVDEPGTLNEEQHQKSYFSNTGGMLITSSKAGCRGFNGVFEGKPGVGGDCSHIQLNEGFILEPNRVYYGNSRFIHESLPSKNLKYRTLIRITLPEDYPEVK